MVLSLKEIHHGFYINLLHRSDRKEEIENELRSIGLENIPRFNAISMPNGRIGCTMSHLKCLEIAKQQNWSHVLIVEDDLQFLEPAMFTNQINKFLSSGVKWDVILLAGNNLPPYSRIGDYAVKVMQCQTTTGYIVNGHYIETLIENIREGLQRLIREQEKHYYYAIDKYWFRLQQKDKWFLITPLTVTQRAGFSDIEQKKTDFTKAMTDLDKHALMMRYKKHVQDNK